MKTELPSAQKCWWVRPFASECSISARVNEHNVLCAHFLHHPSFILFSPCVKWFSPRDARQAKDCCGSSLSFRSRESCIQLGFPTAPSSHSVSHFSQAPPPQLYKHRHLWARIRPGAPSSHSWGPKKCIQASMRKQKKRVEYIYTHEYVCERGRKRKKERVIKWQSRFLHCVHWCGSNQTDVSPQGHSVNTIMLSSFILMLVWKIPDWQACDGGC